MKSIVILLALIAVPMAYAETATIEVPFESHGNSCTFDEVAIEYHCVWQGTPDVFTLEDLEEFKDVLTDEEYSEALQDIIDQQIIEDTPVVVLTAEEILIEQLSKQTELSEGERATLRALANMNDACEIGIEEGARIQSYGLFSLPDRDITTDNVNLQNYPHLRDIQMKIEECNNWNKYRADYLTRYNHIELDDENDLSVRLGIGELKVEYTYPTIPSEDNTKFGLCNALRGPSLYDYGCLVKPVQPMGYIEYPSEIIEAYNKYRSQE